VPQIEVTFDIDANGIVNVSAKDRGTGKTQAITITSSSGLAKDEVEKMVKEAEAHAAEDREKQKEIEARNRADALIYATEKTLQENKDKLPEADAAAAQKAIEEARKAVEQGGADRIEGALQELTRVSHRVAEILYQKAAEGPGEAGGTPGGEPPAGEGKKEGDVIDAEVVDKE
jgi:molecular chaperone DnaK